MTAFQQGTTTPADGQNPKKLLRQSSTCYSKTMSLPFPENSDLFYAKHHGRANTDFLVGVGKSTGMMNTG